VEFAQRMLTKRPTVARISDWLIWLVAMRPTRASDPRTEITRPKDVTVIAPANVTKLPLRTPLCRRSLHKRLRRKRHFRALTTFTPQAVLGLRLPFNASPRADRYLQAVHDPDQRCRALTVMRLKAGFVSETPQQPYRRAMKGKISC
jgi:hypothetical protein